MIAKTRKYELLDALNERMYEERGNACEFCGKPLESNVSGEWVHVKKGGPHGEGRGRYERLHDVEQNPERYKLGCQECHDIYDVRSYKRNIRSLSPEASSRAVKRAMKVAGVGHTREMA